MTSLTVAFDDSVLQNAEKYAEPMGCRTPDAM
jgi:hypothetical protein